ncbi:hypothetical protein ACFQV4_13515 [Streptomyces thermocarboxydus]
MGRELLAAEPAFAAAVERLEPVLREQAGVSLLGATEPDADLTSSPPSCRPSSASRSPSPNSGAPTAPNPRR